MSQWLSVQELAKYVGISKETVYRYLEHGTIPAHRVGKLWKFKSDEIDNWIVNQKAEPIMNAGSKKKATVKKVIKKKTK